MLISMPYYVNSTVNTRQIDSVKKLMAVCMFSLNEHNPGVGICRNH